jgi:hypothetical protein
MGILLVTLRVVEGVVVHLHLRMPGVWETPMETGIAMMIRRTFAAKASVSCRICARRLLLQKRRFA